MAEKTTIARPYAQAIYELAKDDGELKAWSEMLLLGAAVVSDDAMAAIINDPNLESARLADLIIEILGDKVKMSDKGKNMIRVLVENDRLGLLPEITELFEVERAAAEGTVVAEVSSAVKLTSAQQASIAKALTARLGREVSLECSIDETILGGAIIRAGDVVIDGSVAGKLNKLGHELLH